MAILGFLLVVGLALYFTVKAITLLTFYKGIGAEMPDYVVVLFPLAIAAALSACAYYNAPFSITLN